MIKIFISQPMTGIDMFEIKTRRNLAISFIDAIYKEGGYEIIDNLQEDNQDKSNIVILSKDIELLADADLVYFLKGWEKSRGCMVEFTVCNEYNIPMQFEEIVGE